MPSAEQLRANDAAARREWLEAQATLRASCATLSHELDEIARLPGYSLGVRVRAILRWMTRQSPLLLGSQAPVHTARLGGAEPAAEGASLEEIVASTLRMHQDLRQLSARLSHPGLLPFRQVRTWQRRIPGLTRDPARRILAIRERLRTRALPAPLPILPREKCSDLISIVLPTYNRAYSLARAIASVRQQTYPHWQLLVVDDGSTDDTCELARTAAGGADDPRIEWIWRPHAGVSAARNAGLERARGRFVAFLDSDNIWYPDYLERHRALLAGAAPETVASYSDQRWFHGDRRPRRVSKSFTKTQLFHLPQVDLNGLVVRRSALERTGGFDESMTKWVDYELMLRLSGLGNFVHLPRVLGDYYRLEDGISRAPDRERPLAPNLARVRRVRRSLLRVGYVLWDYPSASQAFVHREIRALVARGVDVCVYYAADAETPATHPPGVAAFRVDSARDLARQASLHERNVLHGHFAYPTTTVHLWPAAEQAGIPFTFMPHGVDLFHHKNERRHRIGRIGNSPLCKAAFSIGSFHREYLRSAGVPDPCIVPTRCPVDAEWFAPLPNFERPLTRITLVSRFVEKKGILDFIAIARALRSEKLEFELFGYGPLEAEIAAAAAGADNLELHVGSVSESAVRDICDRASAILLPCRRATNGDMDGLPVILLEGAARGCLLFSSNISSIPDLVETGRSGYLVEPGDIDGFVAAIRSALAASDRERAALRRNAYRQVAEEFGIDRITETLIEAWCR